VHVRDLKFDHVDGTTPDAAIWLGITKDVTIDGISGRFNIGVNVSDSRNVQIKNVDATLVVGHPAAGRVFTAWQCDDVLLANVRADTSVDKPLFFVESWSRTTTFQNIDVRWRYPQMPIGAIFHLTGGSSGTFIDQLRIDNTAPVAIAGSGAQEASYTFGAVEVRGPIHVAPLFLTDDTTLGNRRYSGAQHAVTTIDLQSGWVDHRVALATGTIKSIKVTASDPASINYLLFVNATGKGTDATKYLVAGETIDLGPILGLIGDPFPFNDAAESTKSLVLYTPASIMPGATLTVDVEYYPPPT
jgi:hypothetical protein